MHTQIQDGSHLLALTRLNELVKAGGMNLTVAVYLLSATVNALGSQVVDPAISEVREIICEVLTMRSPMHYNSWSYQLLMVC